MEGFQQDPSNTLPYILQEPSKRKSVKVNPNKVRNNHNSDLNLSSIHDKKGTKTGQDKYKNPVHKELEKSPSKANSAMNLHDKPKKDKEQQP